MEHLEAEFHGYRNYNPYYQCWLPVDEPKAVLLIVHGLADHSGRFGNLVNYFVQRGYAVFGFDFRGHGKSPGKKGYIEKFPIFVEDLKCFVDFIKNKYQNSKLFMIAHSVGGTVATEYAISHQEDIHGIILSAPTLKLGSSVPGFLVAIAPVLSFLIPRVGLYRIDASTISSDKSVVSAYINDPLVYRGKISTRLGVEIIKTIKSLSASMPKIQIPLLILYGTADRLSEPEGSRILFKLASSSDKAIKAYEGFYHEIFNEPKREIVFQDIETWLTSHL